jgi:predicted ATPase/class 3 adenylate cyclase
MQREFPTGTVTLGFTDIEGSSELWEQQQADFKSVLDIHNHLIRETLRQWRGYEVKTQGDSFMLAFQEASDAVACALDIQQKFASQSWPSGEVLVRIGMHTGEPLVECDSDGRPDYFGTVVNRAARIAAAGHGGQVLLSESTFTLAKEALTGSTVNDLGIHRLRGLEQPEHVFEARHGELPERRFPPLKTSPARQVYLPDFPTPFLGRATEKDRLIDLLQDDANRLLLVLGAGGMGKTRLCAQVAGEVANGFADGVRFIDLEMAGQRDELFTNLARQLDLVQHSGKSEEQCALDFLSGKQMLLLVDNAAQIEELTSALDAILTAAPAVKLLLPSRERLQMNRSVVFELEPLLISAKADDDLEALLACESVDFFAAQARRHKSDFEINQENASAVAQLCCLLEGIPLALELAAAWTADLSPAEIQEEMEQHLDVLSVESTDIPERHRAIHSSIDWSFFRLTPDEQRSLILLSVFSGGFTREAAAAICQMKRLEATVLLRRFGAKSLLTHRDTRERSRFGMLNIINRYLREKLQGLEAAEQTREAHARYFADFACEKMGKLRTPAEVEALRDMEDELENLRAALEWSVGAGQHQLAAEIALELGQFLERCGLLKESLRCVETGLDSITYLPQQNPLTKKLHAALLRERVAAHLDQRQWDDASRCAQTSLALFEECDEAAGVAGAHNQLGVAACRAKKFDDARVCLELAETAFKEIGDVSGQAIVWHNLGLTASESGDLLQAGQFLERALQLRRERGDQRGLAETLNNLGVVAQEQGEYQKAWNYYNDSLNCECALQDAFGAARALFNMGEIAELQNRLLQSLRLFAAAQHLFEETGSPYSNYAVDAGNRVAESSGVDSQQKLAIFSERKGKGLAALSEWALQEGTSE